MEPRAILSVMDPAKPIMNMVVNAVANDMGFIQFMSFTVLIIMKPAITSVPTVHADVTIEKTGVKNNAKKNRIPTTTAIRPVLAPAAIPAVDSMKDVVVDVPATAPKTVAMESAMNTFSFPSMFPLSSAIPDALPAATRVPVVSNTSTTSLSRLQAIYS